MNDFTPTLEQQAIIDLAKGTSENILIEALAGAAKTTTLDLICRQLTGIPILSIAFNKRIADEMAKRLPSHVKAQTINAVGHRAWADQINKRQLVVNKDKTHANLKERIDASSREERSALYDQMGDILKAVRLAKTWGYVPDGLFAGCQSLMGDDVFKMCIQETIDEDVPFDIVQDLVKQGIQQGFQGLIDFDDQIFLPTIFGSRFPKYPLVMVDEAQDLSSINHALLQKLVTQRLIAVGDPYQSIYGFRGAHSQSMEALQCKYEMTRMGLSVSFRCPIEVIKKAHDRAPHMQWPKWAKQGEVNHLKEWFAKDIPDGSAIICRNNAPLLHVALELLKGGRGVQIVGTDLGPQLVKALKKLGLETMEHDKVVEAIDAWGHERLRKGKNTGSINDKMECLKVFAEAGPTLAAAIAYAEHIFAAYGQVQLLSGHKSKGLEWETVYHLDPWRIPSKYAESPDEKVQEANVRYVIETRSKSVLNLVTTEGLQL